MVRCPKCNKFSADAAQFCSNCGYRFAANKVNSSMQNGGTQGRTGDNNSGGFENQSSQGSRTYTEQQGTYAQSGNAYENSKSTYTQSQDDMAKKREAAREEINRIKQERAKAEQMKYKNRYKFNKSNSGNKKLTYFMGAIVIVVIIALVVMFGGKITGGGFYGTYTLVTNEHLYYDEEYPITSKETIYFNRNGTGKMINSTGGTEYKVDFVWEKEGKYISMKVNQGEGIETSLGGVDDSTVVIWEDNYIIIEDDISDRRYVYEK